MSTGRIANPVTLFSDTPPKAERKTDPRCEKDLAGKQNNGRHETSRFWFNEPVADAEQNYDPSR